MLSYNTAPPRREGHHDRRPRR